MKKDVENKFRSISGRIFKDLNSEEATRPLQVSDINYPDRIPTDVPDAFPRFVNKSLRIAALLSKDMYNNLKYECLLIDMNKSNLYRILMNRHLPNFLLVESKCLDLKKLKKILQMFKRKNIPTVLWATATLDSIICRKDILPLFTLVFTADSSNVEVLQELVMHKNIFYLPLGVQPRLHNPIADTEKSVFAAYMPLKFLHGKGFTTHESSFLFYAARCYDAEIIDINNLPSSFKKYYAVLIDTLEEHNAQSVYPLISQLLACGINVMASFNKGLQEAFADKLIFVRSYDKALDLLDKLYKDADYRDRLSLLGQRFILGRDTYTHRIEAILDKLGCHSLKQAKPGVSIVCCTHMDCYMDNILMNYQRQTYEKKELIIVLNNPNMDKSLWEAKAHQLFNVRIIQPNRQTSVGHCVNYAVEQACYKYIANFDHDDYYGPEYIRDILNVFKYTGAGLIGKKTHYVYFEGCRTLAMMLPGYDNRYVVNIDGSSIVFKKEIFEKVRFADRLFADIQFSLDCWNNGIKVYSCDKYNHVYVRAASKKHHAFKLSDDEFKALTYTIEEDIYDYEFIVIA